MKLSSVEISFGPFVNLSFEPTDHEADAAWSLFVELSSRIAVQRFDPNLGSGRAALRSLYQIVQFSREVLKATGPSKSGNGVVF